MRNPSSKLVFIYFFGLDSEGTKEERVQLPACPLVIAKPKPAGHATVSREEGPNPLKTRVLIKVSLSLEDSQNPEAASNGWLHMPLFTDRGGPHKAGASICITVGCPSCRELWPASAERMDPATSLVLNYCRYRCYCCEDGIAVVSAISS